MADATYTMIENILSILSNKASIDNGIDILSQLNNDDKIIPFKGIDLNKIPLSAELRFSPNDKSFNISQLNNYPINLNINSTNILSVNKNNILSN